MTNILTRVEDQIIDKIDEVSEVSSGEELVYQDLIEMDIINMNRPKNPLSDVAARYQEAKEFLDFFACQKVYHPRKGESYPTIEPYHWELACYYAGIYNFSNGGNRRFLNIVKARQMGMTTFNAAYASWVASNGGRVLFVGFSRMSAEGFIYLCDNMSYHCSKPSNNRLSFINGGEIVAFGQGYGAGKGESVDLVILEEFANFINPELVWTGLLPCLSYGKSQVIMSTSPCPKGISGHESRCKFVKDFITKHGWFHLPAKRKFDEESRYRFAQMYNKEQYITEVEALFPV